MLNNRISTGSALLLLAGALVPIATYAQGVHPQADTFATNPGGTRRESVPTMLGPNGETCTPPNPTWQLIQRNGSQCTYAAPTDTLSGHNQPNQQPSHRGNLLNAPRTAQSAVPPAAAPNATQWPTQQETGRRLQQLAQQQQQEQQGRTTSRGMTPSLQNTMNDKVNNRLDVRIFNFVSKLIGSRPFQATGPQSNVGRTFPFARQH